MCIRDRPGTTVTEGQLLISGVSETEHIGARFVHSLSLIHICVSGDLAVIEEELAVLVKHMNRAAL